MFKRIRSAGVGMLFIGSVMLPLFINVSSAAAFSGGAGTVGNPYQISTCTELEAINGNLSAHYILVDSVDCAGVSYVPIGSISTPFTGSLDGDGYFIYGVTINTPTTDFAGIFGYITGGSIRNLYVYGANVTAQDRVGILAGVADINSSFSGIYLSQSSVTGRLYVGGMFGIIDTVTVTDTGLSDVTVHGSNTGSNSATYIGGFAGSATEADITNSSVSGEVVGNETSTVSANVGGFLGYSFGSSTSDSYTSASVNGKSSVGGFVGNAVSSSYYRSWASGEVVGTTNVGGFTGSEGLNGFINSFSVGQVTGTTNVGGFAGHAQAIGGDIPSSNYDIYTSGQAQCVGTDDSISYPTTCTGVNASNATPAYYFNNHTNAPLDTWDFDLIWRLQSELPHLITVPVRPDNVKIVRGSDAMTASWQNPADDGGSAVTSYDFKYRPFDLSQPFTVITGISPATTVSQLMSNLKPNTQYLMEVRANNIKGHGIWSGFTTNTLAATVTNTTTTVAKKASSRLFSSEVAESTPAAGVQATSSTPSQVNSTTPETAEAPTVASASSNVALYWVTITALVAAALYVMRLRQKS